MAARKAEIVTWGAADIEAEADKLGLDGSPTKVVKIFTPDPREGGEMLEGDPNEIAKQLAEKLKDVIIEAAS